MALADYRLCDICGHKAFYDAHLNYDAPLDGPPVRGQHYRLDYLGDWAVLCEDCARTNEVVVRPSAKADSEAAEPLKDVQEERRRQDAQWGGPEHDDQHSSMEFVGYVQKQVDRAREELKHGATQDRGRSRFVKIAALAVAAMERIDRMNAKADSGDGGGNGG